MKNKVVLVIGGSGFLGSHVADALSNDGYDVKVLDRQRSKWIRDDQEMIIGDLLDQDILFQSTKNCYAVYNFAAIADLNEAILQPLETVRVNILGNVQALEASRKNHVKRYVYASTVYVNSREGGFYRCSKQASENYVEEYQKSYCLDYTILRYGSLYGPRSDSQNGLWRIVKNVIETGIVKYEGNIESVREYIHVEDAAESSVDILSKDYINESIILSGPESIKVVDMLKTLAEIMGFTEDKIEFLDKPQLGHYVMTPYSYNSDIGKKYIPSKHIDLGQGLLQLIHLIDK